MATDTSDRFDIASDLPEIASSVIRLSEDFCMEYGLTNHDIRSKCTTYPDKEEPWMKKNGRLLLQNAPVVTTKEELETELSLLAGMFKRPPVVNGKHNSLMDSIWFTNGTYVMNWRRTSSLAVMKRADFMPQIEPLTLKEATPPESPARLLLAHLQSRL